jgi:hypothetical protein
MAGAYPIGSSFRFLLNMPNGAFGPVGTPPACPACIFSAPPDKETGRTDVKIRLLSISVGGPVKRGAPGPLPTSAGDDEAPSIRVVALSAAGRVIDRDSTGDPTGARRLAGGKLTPGLASISRGRRPSSRRTSSASSAGLGVSVGAQ